ncbi:MAG: hypothetical protein MJZ33_03755 [Paludibacteraceae bacterium]|nr:hypothetical protein [Paludibacteraceae bacterium]
MSKIINALFFITMFFSCYENKSSDKKESVSSHVNETENFSSVEKIIVNYRERDSVVYDMIQINPMDVIDYYANSEEPGDDVMSVDFNDRYSDYAIQIYREALKKMGYESPTLDVIQMRTKEILGCDVECDSNAALYKVRLARYVGDKSSKEERMRQNEIMKMLDDTTLGNFWNSLIYVREGGFLLKKPTMNGLVTVENCEVDAVSGNYLKIGDKVSFIWNAPKIEEAYHLSNYVFYNDDVSLYWLLDNQSDLLKNLCLIYHYDTVPEINKLVVDEVLAKMEGGDSIDLVRDAYKDVFFCHDGNGKLYIHEGLLNFLAYYKVESLWLVDNLFSTIKYDIYDSFDDASGLFVEYTIEERMKVAAYVIFYFNKYRELTISDQIVKEMVNNESFLRFLRDNECFGLEGFSLMIENLKLEYLKNHKE